ncbi:hypothetical protein MBLNU457_2292t1 [Dothideomycetes sp. NU457]
MSSTTKDSHTLEQIPMTPSLVRAWASANANSFIPPSDKTRHSFCYAFHPKGFTPSVDDLRCARYVKALSDPNMHFFLLRDTTTSEYVGCTRWLIHPRPEPFDMDKEIAAARAECRDHDDLDGGFSWETIEMLRIAQAKAKKEFLGDRAYVYLWILGTVEWAQGKGVGRFALRWGMDKARELGLPVFLESTEQAVGFYENQGFRQLGELDYDARRTGFHRKAGFTAMIWEPEWETQGKAA